MVIAIVIVKRLVWLGQMEGSDGDIVIVKRLVGHGQGGPVEGSDGRTHALVHGRGGGHAVEGLVRPPVHLHALAGRLLLGGCCVGGVGAVTRRRAGTHTGHVLIDDASRQ